MPGVASATTPVGPTLRSPLVRLEMVRFVVDALVAVIAVVDANGMRSADDAGAEKLTVSAFPPTRDPAVPANEMAVPAVTDEVATFCRAPEPTPYKRFPEVKDVCQCHRFRRQEFR